MRAARLSGLPDGPLPHPDLRTGHAGLVHLALGQDATPSAMAGRGQVDQTRAAEAPVELGDVIGAHLLSSGLVLCPPAQHPVHLGLQICAKCFDGGHPSNRSNGCCLAFLLSIVRSGLLSRCTRKR